MKYLKPASTLLLCLILLAGCSRHSEFCQSVKEFEEANAGKGIATLYFYPSTIQMLNSENDSAFNAMAKDIQKLKVITLKNEKESIKASRVSSLIASIRKESFVDLMQMRQNNQQVSVLLRKENNQPKELLGLVYGEENLIIIDLLGSIPVSSLPALMSGHIKLSGFSSVLNNYKPQKQSRQQHEKHSSDN